MGSLTVEPQDEDQEMGSYLRTIYVMMTLFRKLTNEISFSLLMFMAFFLFSQVISGLVLVPLSIALGVLLGWHVYLSLQNKTTIEVVLFLSLLQLLMWISS